MSSLNLEDYIDNNMPLISRRSLEQYPEYRAICTDSDGPHLGTALDRAARRRKTAIQTIGNMSFINTKWLNFLMVLSITHHGGRV